MEFEKIVSAIVFFLTAQYVLDQFRPRFPNVARIPEKLTTKAITPWPSGPSVLTTMMLLKTENTQEKAWLKTTVKKLMKYKS